MEAVQVHPPYHVLYQIRTTGYIESSNSNNCQLRIDYCVEDE